MLEVRFHVCLDILSQSSAALPFESMISWTDVIG